LGTHLFALIMLRPTKAKVRPIDINRYLGHRKRQTKIYALVDRYMGGSMADDDEDVKSTVVQISYFINCRYILNGVRDFLTGL
jgi:hypothetical protein